MQRPTRCTISVLINAKEADTSLVHNIAHDLLDTLASQYMYGKIALALRLVHVVRVVDQRPLGKKVSSVGKVLHPADVLLFRANEPRSFLSIHPGHKDKYLLEPAGPRKRIRSIYAPRMPCRDLTVLFVFHTRKRIPI